MTNDLLEKYYLIVKNLEKISQIVKFLPYQLYAADIFCDMILRLQNELLQDYKDFMKMCNENYELESKLVIGKYESNAELASKFYNTSNWIFVENNTRTIRPIIIHDYFCILIPQIDKFINSVERLYYYSNKMNSRFLRKRTKVLTLFQTSDKLLEGFFIDPDYSNIAESPNPKQFSFLDPLSKEV